MKALVLKDSPWVGGFEMAFALLVGVDGVVVHAVIAVGIVIVAVVSAGVVMVVVVVVGGVVVAAVVGVVLLLL